MEYAIEVAVLRLCTSNIALSLGHAPILPRPSQPALYGKSMLDSGALAFASLAALLTVVPGADTALVIRNVSTRGERAGRLTVLGICSGLFVHASLSALGLAVLLVHSKSAFGALKLAGAAYIMFLGYRCIADAAHDKTHSVEWVIQGSSLYAPGMYWRSFVEGLLTDTLNPKVTVFYATVLPHFIRPGDSVFARSMLLASIHFVMGLLWFLLLVVFLNRIRHLIRRPSIYHHLRIVTGVGLLALGMGLLWVSP